MAEAGRNPGEQPSVCFVTRDFASVIRNGGIGTHVWLMGRLLAERGWDVHVLFCGGVDSEQAIAEMPERMAAEGISFRSLQDLERPPWIDIPSSVDGLDGLHLSQWAMEALEGLHAEHRFDVIEFPDWRALGFRSVQAKHLRLAFDRVALAVKLHGASEWRRRGKLSHRISPWELKMEWCERYAFERADLQLSPSQYMLDCTRAAGWGVRDDLPVVCPYPGPEEPPLTEQGGGLRRLAFFGRLERRKGLDVFLDALEEVPMDYPVVFLGRDTRVEGKRAREIICDRLGDRPYEIEDELDRSGALASLADGETLAVIASQSETFGFTVAECVANRIPFLAARAGGGPEVVRHPEARRRWLFEPTAAALAEAISRRLAADEEAERLLRLEVSQACHHERWNDQVESIYRDTVERFRADGFGPGRSADGKGHGRARPSVSVAVAYYNHGKYLPTALASIAAQTRQPDEVFVVDDGSTGAHDLEVFEQMRTRYPGWRFLRQPNAGPGAARNRCLELASGSHFLPFDADNVARPEMIDTMLTALEADPSPDVVSCQHLAFVEDEDIERESYAFRFGPTGGPRVLAPLENLFGDTCTLFRTEVLHEIGGFDVDRLSPYEDWEAIARILSAGFDLQVVPRPLFWYRTGIGGRLETLTADRANMFRLRRRMVEDVLADFVLDSSERAAMWECMIGFAEPDEALARLQRQHDEFAEWANRSLSEANALHEQAKAEAIALYERRLADAGAQYQQGLADAGARALETTRVKTLWKVTARRTVRAATRRAGEALRRRRGGE